MVCLGAVLILQYTMAHRRKSEPVISTTLPDGTAFRVWKESTKYDTIPLFGFLTLSSREGYRGEVERGEMNAVWRFDLLSDFPKEEVEVTMLNDEWVVRREGFVQPVAKFVQK